MDVSAGEPGGVVVMQKEAGPDRFADKEQEPETGDGEKQGRSYHAVFL
jgi:hypothetical protein